jgi:hypothetical protein
MTYKVHQIQLHYVMTHKVQQRSLSNYITWWHMKSFRDMCLIILRDDRWRVITFPRGPKTDTETGFYAILANVYSWATRYSRHKVWVPTQVQSLASAHQDSLCSQAKMADKPLPHSLLISRNEVPPDTDRSRLNSPSVGNSRMYFLNLRDCTFGDSLRTKCWSSSSMPRQMCNHPTAQGVCVWAGIA